MLIILLTLICFILKLFAKFKFGFSFFVFTNVEHRFTRDLRFSFNSSSCFMFISFPFIHFFCSLFLFNGFFYLSFVFSVCLWVFTFTSFSSQCYTYKNIREITASKTCWSQKICGTTFFILLLVKSVDSVNISISQHSNFFLSFFFFFLYLRAYKITRRSSWFLFVLCSKFAS